MCEPSNCSPFLDRVVIAVGSRFVYQTAVGQELLVPEDALRCLVASISSDFNVRKFLNKPDLLLGYWEVANCQRPDGSYTFDVLQSVLNCVGIPQGACRFASCLEKIVAEKGLVVDCATRTEPPAPRVEVDAGDAALHAGEVDYSRYSKDELISLLRDRDDRIKELHGQTLSLRTTLKLRTVKLWRRDASASKRAMSTGPTATTLSTTGTTPEFMEFKKRRRKSGQPTHYTNRGGLMLALRRCMANVSLRGCSLLLMRDTHPTTIATWEITARAAQIAAARAWFRTAALDVYEHGRSRAEGWKFIIHQYRSDATNAHIWQSSKLRTTECCSVYTPAPIDAESNFENVLSQLDEQRIVGDVQVVYDGTGAATLGCVRKQLLSIGAITDRASSTALLDGASCSSSSAVASDALSLPPSSAGAIIDLTDCSTVTELPHESKDAGRAADRVRPNVLQAWLCCTDAGPDEKSTRLMLQAMTASLPHVPSCCCCSGSSSLCLLCLLFFIYCLLLLVPLACCVSHVSIYAKLYLTCSYCYPYCSSALYYYMLLFLFLLLL